MRQRREERGGVWKREAEGGRVAQRKVGRQQEAEAGETCKMCDHHRTKLALARQPPGLCPAHAWGNLPDR